MKGTKLDSQIVIDLSTSIVHTKQIKQYNLYEEMEKKIFSQGEILNLQI